MRRLKTSVSVAHWCIPSAEGKYEIGEARIPSMTQPGEELGFFSWLDQLLEGGIVIPKSPTGKQHALTILFTGPPGTGKSVLAMELCYRWSFDKLFGNRGVQSLYITSEDHEPWLIDKAKSFRWPKADSLIRSASVEGDKPGVLVMSVRNIGSFARMVNRNALEVIAGFFGIPVPRRNKGSKSNANFMDSQVVVIDSLNTVDTSADQMELFDKFIQLTESGPRLLIIILDSAPPGHASAFWEFVSDIIVRLDRTYVSGYMIRTIEIVKARYQAHVWGTHQLKIYEPSTEEKLPQESDAEYTTRLKRSFPFCMQGGIFIFPSIHYVLSVYKRKSLLGNIDYILSPIKGLNKVLGRGFPKGRCTGFIGSRGGHKSHLGYVQVLSTIIDNPNRKNRKKPEGKGIVVSLRDDEGTTHQAMQSILDQHWPKKRLKLTDLLDQDRLEIMYYPPGYITPEEFFHRMLLSIHRMKRGKSEVHITLLFNSLDQLSSRFPLCSSEHIFVPGIIQMLSAEEVTSIFVAAREPSQYQPEYHGLESLAELLLSFEQKEIPKEEYCKSLYELLPDKKAQVDAIEQRMPNIINAIITRVARFAGGQAAGAEGILELVSKEDLLYRLEGNEGLYCIPRTKK